MANSKRDQVKEQFWRRTVARWQGSGLTVRAYCAEHGLSEPSFYAWRGELARRDQRRAERAVKTAHVQPVHFVSVRVTEPPAAIEIVLSKGPIVRVRPGFDLLTLRQVLAAVAEDRPC